MKTNERQLFGRLGRGAFGLQVIMLILVMLMGASPVKIQAQEYITDVMTIGTATRDESEKLRYEYGNNGWTVLNNDLNDHSGGWYVYVIWKTSNSANPETGYITDLCVSDKKEDSFTLDGRTYYRAASNDGYNGDLLRGTGISTDIYLYYTRDHKNLSTYGGGKRVMTKLSVTNTSDDGNSTTETICWRNSSRTGAANMNTGVGNYIYVHQHFTTQTLKWQKEPTFASNLTYNGNAQRLITNDPWNSNYGILKYRVDGGSWSSAIPTRKDVGDYTVESILEGVSSRDITFAENSSIIKKTVTINPPILKATNLKAVFNQRDKKVNLSWNFSTVGGYNDFKWVVYRDGTKIAELQPGVRAYSDTSFPNESTPTYDVYYVSNFWNITTQRNDTKASVKVNTTRSVPVNNVKAEQQEDRIIFTWTSDAYPKDFGNQFRIFVGDETSPIYTLTPTDMQKSFQWEHRTTDKHTNRQNKVDAETGVPYTEEPLSACTPRNYRIEGVIGDAVLNTYNIGQKAVGMATKFYSLDASKGVYEGSVKLSWHVDQQGSDIAKNYIVERRRAEQESEAWETLNRMTSNDEYLFYTDATALPGVYYDYRITVEDKCADGNIIYNEMTNIGFAKSTGTVTGRIAYGASGIAVPGVDVVMTMINSEGNETEQYHSIYFSDLTSAVTWQYPSEDYAANLFGSGDFSIQMWLYPETFSEGLIANFGGGIGLGMTSDGQLAFRSGSTTQIFSGITIQKEIYNHVVLTRSGTKLKCYVLVGGGEPTVQKDSLAASNAQLSLANASQFELGHFKGSVDEFRLWTKCLSEADIRNNYDHLLVGDEQQLETYWTFDEGLRTQFFDYSRDGSNYRKHHGMIGSNAQTSTLTPAALKLKAKTDDEGNYIIQGIPFTGAGTTYSVIPLYGVHEFNPTKTLLYVGNNALVHTADFEDVSSFPMEGYVYYAGTNIPVEGARLYVDGNLQTKDGKTVQTEANGKYNISVPIGEHYVEVQLDGHTMVDGGRYPLSGKINFNESVRYDFLDSTLVNFVGRVSGGEKNDTLAVGFGASNNNIGQATITLSLNSEGVSFNVLDKDHSTAATEQRIWKSDTTSINSTAWTGYEGSDARRIFIKTDPETGEFSALLPPLKYIMRSIEIPSNKSIEFYSLPEIDLTNVRKEMTDSLRQETEQGDSVWNYYKYNTKLVRTYFAEPQVTLWQVNGDDGFGEKELKDYAVSSAETIDISDIWTKQADGTIKYNYGFPVFARKKLYKFGVYGFESYTNNDTGETDIIPMNGQVLTIANEMSDEQDVVAKVIDPTLTNLKDGDIYNLKRNQLRLDEEGKNELVFTTGAPNVTAPYTRQFSITFERNKRTYSGPQLNGVVLGELTNGDNFVTAGPEHVDMVLRDPPGAQGKVTWKTGTSYTKLKNEVNGAYLDESVTADLLWGTNMSTAVGLGVAIISSSSAHQALTVGQQGSYTWQWENDSTFIYTNAENISSSTGSKYVGAKGDVFIGKSHNFIVGTCRKLGFHREPSGIVLGLKEAVSVNDSIATDFIFSAREVEETMIPKLIETRNALLEFVNDSTTAVNYTNTTEDDIYLTWLKPDDPNYAAKGTYVYKPGTKGHRQDLVLHYNQSVKNWKARLAENEKDKIEAIAARDTYLKENRSFDGGTSYTYSERRDSIYSSTYNTSTRVGVTTSFETNLFLNYAASFGMNLDIKADAGYMGSSVVGDSLDNKMRYAEFEYELNDGNSGTDFTVDILRSPRGWGDIFVLRGGQSYNPYEGKQYAEYYEPEKKHIISYGTEQMEQPIIRISTDGEIGATSATLTDVPAGQMGQFTLHLTNGTTTNQTKPFTYILEVAETYNQKGLEILMDGVPASGRGIYIPAGETVKKVITVRQTDESVLDYEDITLWFTSSYQPFSIYDECKLNVHFKPASSPISLAIQEPVLNTDSKDGTLELKLSNFNRQFKNLKNVGVQYRFQGNTQWVDLHTWVTDKADSTSTAFSLLPPTGDIRYAVNMLSNLSYPEGSYEFRGFTTTPYGTEMVQVYSDIVGVIKDMTRPRNLYTPAPANGILSYGEQLAIEFNEDIVPGYVGADNVIVTAKLNSQKVNHDVAYELMPVGDMPRTVNPVFLKGDFSMDFWLNWHMAGTILHQGEGTDNFALAVDDEGHVKVTIAKAQFVSTKTVPKDEWVYYALSYNAAAMKFDILAQYGETTVDLFENQPVTDQNVQVVNYATDNHLYLGKIWADMHGLSLYNICLDVHEAAATKYQAKDNYVYGLANYWPMDEGHGTVAADTRHTHDFIVDDSWILKNKNYSLRIDNKDGAQADITRIATGQGDSYAIEMWYHNNGDKDEVVFETATPTVEGDLLAKESKVRVRLDSLRNVVLDYGKKSQIVASHTDFPNLMNWHHYALNVVRGQAASFYLDGQRTAVVAEADVPPIEGSHLVVGKNNTAIAFADELRIWHAALSERRLLSNMYNTLDTTDVYSRGLVAYYPFEKTGEENGVTTKVATLENMAPNLKAGDAKEVDYHANALFENTPPLKNAPEETRLIASPVASERKVVVNLTGAGISLRDIEGTTLNITVDQIHDLHGNTSEPIKWTAYVQQNTLKWMKDSVNVFKQYGDPYTFDVNIENRSGNEEYYTLYNMPQWLSLVDSERSDEVTPLSTKTLRFEVNPLVAVGNYDVTIGLQGNNAILEPLRIVMKVSGEKPQWTVDPTKYDHQMNIIGQVYLNGILMENPESMVAAFIGGECRGVASPEKVRGAAYLTMTVYGIDNEQNDMGKAVTFRIWDASKGVAYTDAQLAVDGLPVNITFAQDKILGDFDTPAIWTKSENVEQLIPIHQNWNWIAFGVEPQSTDLDHVFGVYAEWNMLLKNRDYWNDYNGVQWGGGDLKKVKANEMYKLKVTSLPNSPLSTLHSPLSVSGRQLKEDSLRAVKLEKGWNWIAYTPLTTMTVDEALAAANPQKGDIVKSQTGVAIYGNNGWEGSLKALESGRGYLYLSSDKQEKSFVYPTETTASARAQSLKAPRRAPEVLRIFTPVALGLYPSNMTMAIQLRDGDAVVDTAEVAAFIGDECRGAIRASDNGLYYLVISGDGAGQSMVLRTCIDGEIIDIDNTQKYVSDANIGTSWEPYVIDLKNLPNDVRSISIDDADDDDWWSLQGFKIGRKPTQPGVYIHKGNKVTVRKRTK